MKQPDDQFIRERIINGLYTKPIAKKKSKSSQKEPQVKTPEQPEDASPRKLNDMIEEIRRSRDELRRLQESPQLSSVNKAQLKQLTEKYADGSDSGMCLSKKCSMREVQGQLRHRCQQDRLSKIRRFLKQQLKSKQSCEFWQIERQALRMNQLEEKIRLKLELKDREQQVPARLRQWKTQLRLTDDAKRNQRQYCHIQSMEKIDMLRRARKRLAAQERKAMLIKEKESWRDMKFKEFNAQRIASARKELEEDTIELYRSRRERTTSARSRPTTVRTSEAGA